MKKIILCLLVVSMLIPQKVEAQKNAGAAAAVVGLVAIGAGVAAVQQMKESAELTATQWVLDKHPELTSFSLKTMDFNGKKVKDMSSASVLTFNLQEFTPSSRPELNGKKQVLLCFTSAGWITDYGIDFDKVRWYMIDDAEWLNMMTAYVKVASGVTDESRIKEQLVLGKVVNKGLKVKGKVTIPFYKLEGDMYVVTDYSDKMKFLYNERSFGIFLKDTKDLVQIKRSSLIEIHEFFFED